MKDLETGNIKGVAVMNDEIKPSGERSGESRSRFEYGVIIIQLLQLVKGLRRKRAIERIGLGEWVSGLWVLSSGMSLFSGVGLSRPENRTI
jgi:hypothetical protein